MRDVTLTGAKHASFEQFVAYIETIILPRQARDKHSTRESTQKRGAFCRLQGGARIANLPRAV